ncbi:hypothetical protein EC890511_4978, partial [Escherichia coli 89.0511]
MQRFGGKTRLFQ